MNTPYTVETTAKSFEILAALRELEGATLRDLTDRLDIPKSTIHRHLETLENIGFVQVNNGRYQIGFRFLELGEYARNRKKAYQLAEDPVVELAAESGERAQFVVEEHGKGVYLHIETGQRAVRTGLSVGHRINLHSTAAGKVILSCLPEDRVDQIVDEHGLSPLTDKTITDREALYNELSDVRERGYAFNREENIEGLRAVAGPVTDEDGDLVGVLSISGPSNRLIGEWFTAELPDLILGTANELELRIAYA